MNESEASLTTPKPQVKRRGKRKNYPKTKEYRIWTGIKSRCYNPNRACWERYGKVGIRVCDRWLNSFENFLADMGKCPEGMEIDRWPNQRGNYDPNNCRWATLKQQARNKRNNRILTVRGVTACLAELCDKFGLPYKMVQWRLDDGWPVEEAFFSPPGPRRKNLIIYDGSALTITEWSKRLNIGLDTLCVRLKRGWSVERTLSTRPLGNGPFKARPSPRPET